MTNILLCGCSGRMGAVVSDMAAADDNVKIVCGVDVLGEASGAYPAYETLGDCKEDADVVVDFSNPAVFDELLAFCVDRKMPLVICTTGLSEDQLAAIDKAAEKIAILRSANMSVGINVMIKLLKQIAPYMSEAGYDIEIVEKHHNQKLDAPSGTALALAEAANEEGKLDYVYDRSQVRQKRDRKELGISAVRGGTIVGTHEVIFAGEDEVITFEHMAYSRKLFAKGALEAAKFLAGKKPGMYSMQDVI
ncbi:MAG: 4-hydroxy-tetrahydrodipicolinate reductase [Lachnospiraceae bacterium]|nr:4-hydroxy-tetrahydrodipicolinate reductase [Lachnospiraceae bacterium]